MTTSFSTLSPGLTITEAGAVILTAVREAALADRIASTVATSRRSVTYPKVTSDITAYEVSEAQEVTLSDLGTDEVTLTPKKYVGASKWSNESLEDAFNDDDATAILRESIVNGLVTKLDAVTVAAINASTNVAGASDLVDLDGFSAALAQIESAGAVATSILVSPASALALRTLKESSASRKPLLAASVQDAAVLALSGCPIVVSRHVADDVALVSAQAGVRGVYRTDIGIEFDRSVFALTRQTLILGEVRFAAGVVNDALVQKVSINV